MTSQRKRSPRAPSLSLDEAIDKVMIIYNNQALHTIPTTLAAQDLGYKDATNGAAITALASLKYYGLLLSPSRGQIVVAEDVQKYKHFPDEEGKREILKKWVRTPKIYADILDKYPQNPPSDALLKYDLVTMGFSENSADEFLEQFKKTIDFSEVYDLCVDLETTEELDADTQHEPADELTTLEKPLSKSSDKESVRIQKNSDRIPIRLSGGRRAWLEIPEPFYEADKKVITSYVQIIVTDD